MMTKGIPTISFGHSDKTALQKDAKLVLTDILEKLESQEKHAVNLFYLLLRINIL
jgi:hypothetical protein